MTMHTFTMTEEQATLIHKLASSHMHALKNWIASNVETGKHDVAQNLVKELRQHEAIFAAFNMTAKQDIAKFSGKPLVVAHTLKN